MDFIKSGFSDAIKKEIQDSFVTIIDELLKQGETLINHKVLTSFGRQKYANYITNRIGIFPLFATSKTASVNDVYINVHISQEIERERYKDVGQIEDILKNQRNGKIRTLRKESPPRELLSALNQCRNGFALLGNPGYGKTTAFRKITISAAQGLKIRGRKRIPIFLAVRDMTENKESIWDASINFFKWLDISEPEGLLKQLLKKGKLLLLLDGLDETTEEHQKKLVKEIDDLQIKFDKSLFCVSSRPYGLSVGLKGFTKWEVLPMKFEDRIFFIEKWFANIAPEKGKRLIKSSKVRPEVLELGSNPFFLSIVCALYYNDLDIPSDISELYSRCIEGLLGGWDAFRNIARETILRGYSLQRRKLVVNWVAAHLFQENKIVFSETDLSNTHCLEKISKVLKKEELPTSELLNTLYNDFGILVERAPNIYSFSHLSLQEFCVAEYIIHNRQEISLLAYQRKKSEWQEIIKLVARMLPNANEFIRYFANSINFNHDNEIPLLLNIIKVNPVCSEEIELLLYRKIALLVLDTVKYHIHNFKFENDIISLDVAVNSLSTINKRKQKKENKNRSKKNHIAIKNSINKEKTIEDTNIQVNPIKEYFKYYEIKTISYLPSLTNVILNSGFIEKDLGIENNHYFKILKENQITYVKDVEINLLHDKK